MPCDRKHWLMVQFEVWSQHSSEALLHNKEISSASVLKVLLSPVFIAGSSPGKSRAKVGGHCCSWEELEASPRPCNPWAAWGPQSQPFPFNQWSDAQPSQSTGYKMDLLFYLTAVTHYCPFYRCALSKTTERLSHEITNTFLSMTKMQS